MENIKIGDLVLAKYKFGCVSGIVKKIKKNVVVVDRYQQCYDNYYPLHTELNITISRIREINPQGITIEPLNNNS
jgi:hypothetical protein